MNSTQPDPKYTSNSRYLLRLTAIILITAGGFILVRFYFSSLKTANNPTLSVEYVEPQSQITQIAGVDTSVKRVTPVWGEDILGIEALPSQSYWMMITRGGVIQVGEIVDQGFRSRFTIPITADFVRVYDNGYLSYVIPYAGGSSSKLILVNQLGVETTVVTLPSGWDFSGVIFSLQDLSFYYSITKEFNQTKFYRLVVGEPLQELFTASGLSLAVISRPEKQIVEYQDTISRACGRLDLVVKEIESLDCKSVMWNHDSVNYRLTSGPPSTIDQIRVDNSASSILLRTPDDIKASLVQVADDFITYLASQQTTDEAGVNYYTQSQIVRFNRESETEVGIDVSELNTISQLHSHSESVLVVHGEDGIAMFDGNMWQDVDVPGCDQSCEIKIINYQTIINE